ncbi:hypothetical protein HMPREF3159_13185 [Brachybacterium sp. HMSC06H03]|uniref:hypothetical protein n=1 Tax=Brachybacterium sp. HMSC06H03 TaxID=1581127 RepID=UPI0008A52CC7|nr:hypothetical protein [Brachybacterium sp. HMSC06H03]OFT48872.1 hypothetical protein HMPREF3159_13185 [Brachybacterium sp. HMSC06H03]
MTDKTLGAYERHESPDYADGGVAAALIEKEAENADAAVDYHAMWWKAEREREKAERERDEALASVRVLARENIECHERFRAAEPRPLTPDAMTAREHLDAAWDAAHVPADGMIPAGAKYITRNHAGGMRGPFTDGEAIPDTDPTGFVSRRLLDPPRPEGSEGIDEPLRQANAAALGGALTPEQRRALADHLAAMRVRVVAEEDPR